MANLGTFSLSIGVNTSMLQSGLANATSQISSFANKAESVGNKLSIALSAPLALFAKKAIEAFGELEALKKALGTVETSAEGLANRLNELNEVAKLPGVGYKEAIQADVRLRSVGISADIAKRAMLSFGNAIATAGGGKAQFDSVIFQLTQMSAKSKVLSQDFRPIIEAVPMVATAVKKLYGTVDTEQIQSKMSKAGINSQKFIEQLITELEKLPRVSGGVKNAIENLGDTIFKSFAKIGETIDKNVGLQTWLEKIGTTIEGLADKFAMATPETQQMILTIGGLATVIPPILALVGTLGTAMAKGFALAASAAGVVVSLIAGLGIVIGEHVYTTNKLADASKNLAQIEDEVRASIHGQVSEVGALTDVLNDNTSSLDDKKKALLKLQEISPQYFKGLKAEKLDYSELNVSLSKYITNLENAGKAKAIQAQLDVGYKVERDIMANPADASSWVEQTMMMAKQKWINAYGDGFDGNREEFVLNLAQNAAKAVIAIQEARKGLLKEMKGLFLPPTVKTGGGDNGGGGFDEDSANKKAKAIKKIQDDLLRDTQRAQIDAISDTQARQRADLQQQFNEQVHAYSQQINELDASFEEKKPLWAAYTNFVIENQRKLSRELSDIRLFSDFKSLKSIDKKGTDPKDMESRVYQALGISPDGVDKYKESLKERISSAMKYLQDSGEMKRNTNIIEGILGLSDGTVNTDNFKLYEEQALAVINANNSMQESFNQLKAGAVLSISTMVGEMIAGTATIQDLGKSLLSTIAQALADIAKVNIAAGIFSLNFGQVAKGIFAGIGSGILGGLAKKQNNEQAKTQAQAQTSTVLRGGDIFWAGQRYQTIRGF